MNAEVAWDAFYGKKKDKDNNFPGPGTTYTQLSKNYDEVVEALGFNAPTIAVKTFLHSQENKDTEQLRVLDIAVGTGLVGECLRKYNFKGSIDGIDNNEDMLKKAKLKNVYRNLWCKSLSPGDPFMVETGGLYDGILASGAISQTHIKPDVIFDLMDIITPNGYLVVASRTTYQLSESDQDMKNVTQKLVETEIAELVSKEKFKYYDVGFDDNGKCIPCFGACFCYKKL